MANMGMYADTVHNCITEQYGNQKQRTENPMNYDKDAPGWPHGKIPVIMLFGLNSKQKAEIKAEAAKAGVAPLIYLYGLVQREPERFIAPMPADGSSAPRRADGDVRPASDTAAPRKDNFPRQ